jgi:hypothetical protein
MFIPTFAACAALPAPAGLKAEDLSSDDGRFELRSAHLGGAPPFGMKNHWAAQLRRHQGWRWWSDSCLPD